MKQSIGVSAITAPVGPIMMPRGITMPFVEWCSKCEGKGWYFARGMKCKTKKCNCREWKMGKRA